MTSPREEAMTAPHATNANPARKRRNLHGLANHINGLMAVLYIHPQKQASENHARQSCS
jgi:hypothetical protein